jgi:hypothetical protein
VSTLPYCRYNDDNGLVKFNYEVEGTFGSSISGGLCRVGGSPDVFQIAANSLCSDDNMITSLADCEAAFNELSLENSTFSGEVSNSSALPGCMYNSVGVIYFNSVMDAENLD